MRSPGFHGGGGHLCKRKLGAKEVHSDAVQMSFLSSEDSAVSWFPQQGASVKMEIGCRSPMRGCRFFLRPIPKSPGDVHGGEHLRRRKLGAEDYSGDVRECRFLLRAFSGVHL